MTKRVQLFRVGRGLLLSVAVGTLPIAGCAEYPDSLKQLTIHNVGADEKLLYERAIETSNPVIVSSFLSKYPESRLIRSLLTSLSPEELQRVSPAAVDGVDPDILASLPRAVRLQLGVNIPLYLTADQHEDAY